MTFFFPNHFDVTNSSEDPNLAYPNVIIFPENMQYVPIIIQGGNQG